VAIAEFCSLEVSWSSLEKSMEFEMNLMLGLGFSEEVKLSGFRWE